MPILSGTMRVWGGLVVFSAVGRENSDHSGALVSGYRRSDIASECTHATP
jgi:hypothetical protein